MTLHPEPAREGVSELPRRVQLRRTKGWRMPANTVRCVRPGPHGNPFRVGGYFMIGDPDPRRPVRMAWCECLRRPADPGFTLIETNDQAVEWYRRYAAGWAPQQISLVQKLLGGKNLACFCALEDACHCDVLLEIANPALAETNRRQG